MKTFPWSFYSLINMSIDLVCFKTRFTIIFPHSTASQLWTSHCFLLVEEGSIFFLSLAFLSFMLFALHYGVTNYHNLSGPQAHSDSGFVSEFWLLAEASCSYFTQSHQDESLPSVPVLWLRHSKVAAPRLGEPISVTPISFKSSPNLVRPKTSKLLSVNLKTS